jgi:hypothetical protein
MKYIFRDIGAVQKHGTDLFLKNDSWPLSDVEFNKLTNTLFDEYYKIIENLENTLYDICLVELNFIGSLIQILQANYVENYCIKNNIKILKTIDSNSFDEIDLRNLGSYYKNFNFPHGKSIRFLRKIVKNILFNKHLFFSLKVHDIFRNRHVIGVGSNDRIKSDFIKNENLFCDYFDWPELFTNNNTQFNAQYNYNELIINPFFKSVENLNPFFLDGINFDLVKQSWNLRFMDVESFYHRVKYIKVKKKLLITEVGNPLHKIIALRFQRDGHQVYCFHHGNNTGALVEKHSHQIIEGYCKNIVLPATGIKEVYEKNYSQLFVDKKTNTKYCALHNNYYGSLFLQLKRKKARSPNKTIMLMGFPMKSHRFLDEPAMDFIFKVSLELRLARFLKNNGFRVIYKAHPERAKAVFGVFESEVSKCIYSKFEDVLDEADVILFTYPSTTTFGYALNSNKNLVLINMENNSWDASAFTHLGSRVNMVPAGLDKQNRVVFNEEKLLEALRLNSNKIDTKFVKKFMWN